MSESLLLEIGCEELPPGTLLRLAQALAESLSKFFDKSDIQYGSVLYYATPRRLAVKVLELAAKQPDKVIEKRGPAVSAAYTADGTASKAAAGFAQSVGVSVDKLDRVSTAKGEWLVFRQTQPGDDVTNLLAEWVNKSIALLPIAKRMRWGETDVEFARPVHWVVLMYGSEIVNATILGLTTGNETYGHRFHAPEALKLRHADDYENILLEQGKVVADFESRKQRIKSLTEQVAAKIDGIAQIDDGLLEEITAINEWPVPVIGEFDQRFLKLPAEVLITTMKTHQKYFPVNDQSGQLLHYFITFSNIESVRPESVKQGNERVIEPRLADAEFFWEQDRKVSLEKRVEQLSSIVFQKDLGTLREKTERLEKLSEHIAVTLKADRISALRAARLSKADLLTNMVGEFASLQGTMGRYYALEDQETKAVAVALEEQYFPKQSGAETPQTPTGQILAIADKTDTLCGIFSVGLHPTGDKDPYALRRACLGILRILIENRLSVNFVELVQFSLSQFKQDFDYLDIEQKILNFVQERLKGYCLERGYSLDEFDAVLSVGLGEPNDFMLRIEAVKLFRQLPEAESLAAANKRIINILKKAQDEIPATVGTLEADEEMTLYQHAQQIEKELEPLMQRRDYPAALNALAQLRVSVDAFFDHVMVNTENRELRLNRLALLSMLSKLFLNIADISKLQPTAA